MFARPIRSFTPSALTIHFIPLCQHRAVGGSRRLRSSRMNATGGRNILESQDCEFNLRERVILKVVSDGGGRLAEAAMRE